MVSEASVGAVDAVSFVISGACRYNTISDCLKYLLASVEKESDFALQSKSERKGGEMIELAFVNQDETKVVTG